MNASMHVRPPAAPASVFELVDAYGAAIDGYAYARDAWGVDLMQFAESRISDYHATGRWSGTFEELRCLLFAEQRRMHFDVYHPSGTAACELFDLCRALCRAWTDAHPDDPVTFTAPPPLPEPPPILTFVGYVDEFDGRPAVYPPPKAEPVTLSSPPQLESWNHAGHPDQVRLAASLDAMQRDVQPGLPVGPLALRLDVGLPPGVVLTAGGRDLDNYLLPIARRLGVSRIWSASATKSHASTSRVTAALVAKPVLLRDGYAARTMRLTGSHESPKWKTQIRDAVSDAAMIDGASAVDLHASFRVASRRNWTSLWKPAIDALGPILGVPDPKHPFRPHDDRITALHLHRFVDDSLGNDVGLTLWWRAIDSE